MAPDDGAGMTAIQWERGRVVVGDTVRRGSRAVLSAFLATVAPIYRIRAELLLTISMLGGWALLTWGIVLFTTPKVWPLSAGLLLLSCGGWRMLWTVASYGLYGLTRVRKPDA